MTHEINRFGQPVGLSLPDWISPPPPAREAIAGRYCRLEPLAPRHAADLFAAESGDSEGRCWTYLPYGPFESEQSYREWIENVYRADDVVLFAIVTAATERAVGVAGFLRINVADGSIEIGHVHFSPLLQRTTAATEAIYLLMRQAFTLGYRRVEWKCDSFNAPSRAAAWRLGFSFEGIFRQDKVTKGRTRDTAWFAAIDREWPLLDEAFGRWLDPSNFDEAGAQRISLSDLTEPLLHTPRH